MAGRRLAGCLAALAALAAVCGAQAGDARPALTVGLVDTFSPEFYMGSYSPTLDRLIEALPQYRFRVVELGYEGVKEEIARRKPDFVVASASVYVSLIDGAGLQQIATRLPRGSEKVSQTVASAFVVRAGSELRTLQQARGRRAAITQRASFDGWLIAQGELVRRGEDAAGFFSAVLETGYGIPDVPGLLRLGRADVGVLSTCELERLEESGAVGRGELRVLDERPGDGGCRRSTDRYPDVVFASLPHVSAEAVADVTVALLTMPSQALGFRWTVGNDFVATYGLLKALRAGPFAPQPWTPALLWRSYRTEILLALGLALAAAFHIATLNWLVRKRTRELTDSVAATRRFHDEAQESRRKLLELERVSIVSQLSSMFAHEIKQPMTNIGYYAGALEMLAARSGDAEFAGKAGPIIGMIGEEVRRAADIVEHVRGYARKKPRRAAPCSLSEIAARVAGRLPGSALRLEAGPQALVEADAFELEFVATTFVTNALQAVAQQPGL
ncbi:MAG: PhnD/SsuA/transferrin family substrate-binding protein, partial [Duodenibacillus sp.]|nr:PhnD/SsuA/transferrin family substrate-binding protein [Duodenibacillus sp.]